MSKRFRRIPATEDIDLSDFSEISGIHVVLKNGSVYFGTIRELAKDHVILLNTFKRKLNFDRNDIREFVIDG